MKTAFIGLAALLCATPALAHTAPHHTLSHGSEAVVAAVIVILGAVALRVYTGRN